MSDAAVQSKTHKPYLASLEKGKPVAWCRCGKSAKQPFCDGSHKGTSLEPFVFSVKESKDYLLCGCKRTQAPPFCDGSHNNLDDGYELASPEEIAATQNAKLIARTTGDYGKAALDGGAFVLTPDPSFAEPDGHQQWRSLIGLSDGAKNLNLLALHASKTSPWRIHKGGDTILFVMSGAGHANIEGVGFEIGPEIGVYVRKGEAFRLEPSEALHVIAAVSPQLEPSEEPEHAAQSFSKMHPVRCVGVDLKARQQMADRFYQVLIGEDVGCEDMTQFIGEVPQSRAAFHRHLYEEAIVILSGEGVMWTRNCKTLVKPGDVIYLPPRQEHSLECTSSSGLRLMGVFYPSGSPAINY